MAAAAILENGKIAISRLAKTYCHWCLIVDRRRDALLGDGLIEDQTDAALLSRLADASITDQRFRYCVTDVFEPTDVLFFRCHIHSFTLTEPTDWAVADAMENLLSSPPTDVGHTLT